MTKFQRFALMGKSGSGKSEIARILQKHLSCEVIKTGRICRQIALLLFGNEDKRSTQQLDDALLTIDDSIFLKASLRSINTDTSSYTIDSLRFLSDLDIAKALDCQTIRVEARDDIRVFRLRQRGQQYDLESDGQHRSEVELSMVPTDFTVQNNGDFDSLEQHVLRVLSHR